MEYNKKTFCKANDKKVLHKIRKHWVVVSTALLMALGGGAAATTHVSAHADANNNNGANTSSTDTVKENLNQKLQTPQQNNNAQSASNNNQSAQAQNSAKQASANSNNNAQQLTPSNILKAAANLHGAILGNAAQNGAKAQPNNNAAQQNQSQQSGNGFNAPKVNNKGAKANTSNPLKGVAPKMQVGQSNPADQANDNNNKVDFTRPRVMLGDADSPQTAPNAKAGAFDQDGLFPTAANNSDLQWDPNTQAVESDYDGWISDQFGYLDNGEITVNYVDPSDNNFLVGSSNYLTGSDGAAFSNAEKQHYLNSIPQLQGPYGTGYHLNTSNPFDSGKNITKFIGNKDQELTINVQANPKPELPGQIEVEYQDAYNKNVLQSHLYTYSDNQPFNQQGFINNPLQGYDVDHWNTSTVSADGTSDVNPNDQDPIQKFTNKNHQVLHIYLKLDTNNDSGLVKYINESDGSLVGQPRTVYGTNGSSMNNDGLATDYVPSGYTFDPSFSNSLNGEAYSNGISPSNATFGNGQSPVMYVAVKKGIATNAQGVNYGTVNVNYQTSDGHGNNKTIDVMPTTGPNGSQFNISNYTGTVPDGYTYDGKNNSNGVTNYINGNAQNVYVTVKRSGGMPSQVSNAYIEYKSVDPSNPNAAPQVIKDNATNNYTFPIYGAPGTKINYDQYTSNPPQGYVYEGMGSHNDNLYSNQTNVILVESTKEPDDNQQNGYAEVEFIDQSDGNKVVHTSDYEEPAGFDFGLNNSNSPLSNLANYAPSGYLNSGQNPSYAYSDIKAGQTDVVKVIVTRQNANPAPASVTDRIEYDVVNPNTDAIIKKLPITKQATGTPGNDIDYTPFIQNIPDNNYTFYKFGSPISPDYEPDKTDHIDVISKNNMPSPIYIHYINQDGEDVDNQSGLDSRGLRIDEDPLEGDLGQTYTSSQITSLRPVPGDYVLAPGQDNVSVSVSNHPQTIDLMVNGVRQSPQTVKIKQIVSDANGNKIMSDVIPVQVSDVAGAVRTFNGSDYSPAPSSHYTIEPNKSSDNSSSYNVEVGDNTLVQGPNGTGTEGTPIKNDTITFAYTETQVTGNFVYEDTSDGDAVVGSKQITTNTPNQVMNGQNGVYKQYNITGLLPAGYQLDTSAKQSTNGIANANASNLLDGHTYVIYVDSAHTQSSSDNTQRTGYGYVTVNYQTSDGHGHWNTVATETASGNDGSEFNPTTYETQTPNGRMPDAYYGAQTTPSDNVTKFDKTQPQTFNLHVQQATDFSHDNNYGQPTSDQINYVLLDNNDNVVNPDPFSTTRIEGKDGSPIDYAQYTHIVPAGYSYAGMGSDIPDYTMGMNSTSNPIATIYVKKSVPFSHNTIPGYHPANTNPASDGHGHSDPNSTNKTYNPSDHDPQSGNYFPWQGGAQNNGQGNAVLDGPENPFDPITAPGYTYNSDAPTMPNSYEWDNKGVLPKGYMPAWVPKDKGDYNDKNDYVSGYVPSDDIPSDYEAGFVPNGNGGYVPGFIPMNTAVQPGTGNQTNGGKKIPKYVPSKVPNGNGGTTNGGAPDQSPYATNSSATLNIQYVDATNHNDVIQTIPVEGSVGSSLNLTSPSNTYLYDLPSGYTFQSVVGQKSKNGKYYTIDNASDGFDNVPTNNDYGFSDNPHTIQIALNHMAVGTVVYKDVDNPQHPEVGSAMIDGVAGTDLDFHNQDKKYLQLLPYNYNSATMQNYTPILDNGGVYEVDVHESHDRNAPSANNNRNGYGHIIINYRDANNNSYVIGTDNLMGANGTNIPNANSYTDANHIPYGYKLVSSPDAVNGDLTGDTFNSDNSNNVININVTPDSSKANTTAQGHDLIEYVEENANGQDKAITLGTNGKPVPQGDPDAGANPMTFDITGDAGSTIDYSPYQINVPSGYYYAGMGNHSTVIDGAHDTADNPEVIYVKPAISNPNYHKGTVTINYVDNSGKASDTNNGKQVGTTTINGNTGSNFDNGYYEDNAPKGYVYNNNATNIRRFSNGNQTDTIDVVPKAQNVKQFGTINIQYQDAATGQPVAYSSNQDTLTVYGMIGSYFNSNDYAHNVPKGYTFDHVLNDNNVNTFMENADGTTTQTITVVIDHD